MASCVNKNDKNFKVLEKKYGSNLAELFTRLYSTKAKLLPDGEFYIPTEKEFFKWYELTRENKLSIVDYSIAENPNLPMETIKQLLKGVIHSYKGELYITAGWSYPGSMVINEEQKKIIFNPNYEFMQKLAKEHPDRIQIIDTNKSYVKKVKINAPNTQPLPNERPDSKITQKYFPNNRVQKVNFVLNRISDSSHPLNELAKKLRRFIPINNVDIELVDVPYFENLTPDVPRADGYYDENLNKIFIAQGARVTNGLSETLILHEVIHAFTKQALKEDTKAVSDFEKLYNHVTSKLGVYKKGDPKDIYPTANLDEFMTGIFTNPRFILQLQKMEPIDGIKHSNLFEEVIDYILSLLGLNNQPSLYNQAVAVASQILDTEYYRIESQRESFEMDGEGFMYQMKDDVTLPSEASPKTLKLIKDFLKQVGVDVRTLTEINVNGVKQDANGVAQIMQKLISVVEGKEAQALPEEAMHFAVAIIKQTDPKLYQKLLKEINGYNMLKEVFKTYGNSPLYQKDGKPDVIKLKEEAIAKVLVDKIIGKVEGVSETSENVVKVQSWWKSIVEWFKNLLYQKSGFDQVAIDIISGKSIGNADDIREAEDAAFLQKSKQDLAYDALKDFHNRIDKKQNAKGEEKYFIDGKEIKHRVTDFAKGSYERWQQRNNIPKSEADEFLDELRKEKGTAGHNDFEKAFHLLVDENGYLKKKEVRDSLKLTDPHRSFTGDQAVYEVLRTNLEQRLESYPEGTRFLSEVRVYNGQNTAGTIDFVAITPDGKIHILDWKFMSLDTEKYSDVPFYKIDSWNIQMNQYKGILKLNYGIEEADFGETRMIPILAKYSRGKRNKQGQYEEEPKLTGVKIGGVDVSTIPEAESYLLPVPTPEESTGNTKVDKLIGRLNEMYEKFSKQKVTPAERPEKASVLNSLFTAIRRLQIKKDAKPIISQVRILNRKIDKLIKEYETKYKGADPTKISEIEKSNFLKELNDAEYATRTYSEINKSLRDIVKDDKELYNELLEIADTASDYKDALDKIEQEFVSELTAKEEGFKNFMNPEKLVTKLAGWFGSTSTLQIKSVQLLFRKANKALGKAAFSTEEKNTKLLNIKDEFMQWAKSKGLSNKDLFSYIKKKDKNQLLNQYEPKFYQDLARAVKDNDVQWMRDNLDIDAVKESMAKRKEEEYKRIENRGRDGSPEEQAAQVEAERRKADRDYSIENEKSYGWYKKDILQKHPKKNLWETQEWKTLNKPENAPAKALYDYIIEQNNEFANLGYISKKEARVFLPFVRSTLVEAAVTGGKLSLGDRFWKSISIDEGDVGYGQLDPDTGQPINTVPIYFTREFSDGDYSEDIFKNMALYNESAYRYKYLTEIEEQIRAISRVERNKKTIQTSIFGNAKIVNNEVQYNPVGAPGASANVELLDSMIKAIIYGQKYVDNAQFDAILMKLGGWGKKINEKIGINVFPEDLDGKQVTLNKVVDALNNSFQFVTLGVNIGSSISNFVGGTAQSIIKAGKFYTTKDFIAAEQQIFVNKFNGEDKNKFIKAIEYFMPFTDNYNREIMKKLSVAAVTEEGFQDLIMSFMKGADRAVQTANFYAFLNNTIVVDGKIVNAREYLRSKPEYQNKYQKTSEERAALDEKFEQEVKLLIQDLGVMKLAKIENGRMVIPGVDRMSNDVLDIRRKVQQLSKDAMGNLSEDDLRTINMNILGKSMMVFKNWIPRLVDVRLGGLKYNAASDAYEWGRIRMIISVLTDRMYGSLGELNDLLSGNDRGMDILRKSYEKLRAEHFQQTGENLELTEEMFIELFRENVRATVRDLALLTALFGLTVAIKAATPDDDEDKAVLNQWRYASKISDKLLDELMYFYNPTSLFNLVGSGPFPAMGIINNGYKLMSNFLAEMFGLVVSNEEIRDDAKPIKYLMKTFPFTNQIVGYLPMVYPDIAKDLGIKMQSNYGIR